MKNSICGFNQKNAVCMGLKGDDLLFLRWLVDFSHSPKMKKKMIDGDVYYWVNYQAVLDDLPVLGVSKYQLRRRILEHLVKCKVLKHKQIRETGQNGGTFSYFAFGESYELLIQDGEKVDEDAKVRHPLSEIAPSPCDKNVTPPVTEMSHQRPFVNSNPSLKQEDNTPTRKDSVGAPPLFSKDVRNFVTKAYPETFERIKGYPHPKLTPVQRYRTEQIISDYLENANEDIANIEGAAEYFIENTETDGNIRAFAHPKTIECMIYRM